MASVLLQPVTWVVWTTRPSGSGQYPQKWFLIQIYLLPGVWGRWVMSYLFRKGRMRQKNVESRILIFAP